jgi:hypothetical protein
LKISYFFPLRVSDTAGAPNSPRSTLLGVPTLNKSTFFLSGWSIAMNTEQPELKSNIAVKRNFAR